MDLQDLAELHYITPIVNVPSICAHGILSHQHAQPVQHESVALESAQDRRSHKLVPLGDGSSRPLHSYVNLYIHARNPMLYSLKDRHMALCVLRVSTGVMDILGTAVADQNAASNLVRFYPSPAGLEALEASKVFAEWWGKDGKLRCAEVLVPDCVPPEHLLGAYVSCLQSQQQLQGLLTGAGVTLGVDIDTDLFFQ